MAYYTGGSGLQWGGILTSPQQLASVIQGEASSQAGQFAVAATMYNRMSSLGIGQVVGGGSGDVTQVVTPSQFNGWQSPSANAQSLANDLWNGKAPQGGSTGNALFYAAPSTSNAAWANPNTASGQGLFGYGGNNIGGNYFSDTQGPPSANFVAPQYGGGGGSGGTDETSGIGSNTSDESLVDPSANYTPDFNTLPDNTFDITDTASGQGGIGSDAVAGGTASSLDSSAVDWNNLPNDTFDNSAATDTTTPDAAQPGLSGGVTAQLPTSVAQAGNAIDTGASTAGKTVQSGVQNAATGIAGTLASVLNSIETYTSNAFVVVALVALGAIFVAYGLGLFGKRELSMAFA